jgi:hypothetical protein
MLTPAPRRFDFVQNILAAAVVLCFGLIPSFHLVALQLATILILISVLLRGRTVFRNLPKLQWFHILLLQFVLIFTLNAILYPSMAGNMRHFQKVALESWGMTFIGFVLIWLYLGQFARGTYDLRKAFVQWLPIGLFISFLTMSFFFFGSQDVRVRAFSTNPLVPPMWFLSLSLISFCWFHDLSTTQKLIRIALMTLAAIMALYSGGRMILVLWALSATALAICLVMIQPQPLGTKSKRKRNIAFVGLGVILGLLGLLAIDKLIGGTMTFRILYTIDSLRNGGLSAERFLRVEIWTAALRIVSEFWPLGAGQVNERLLIHEIIERDWWFRAHQTYLSYLIAGGLPALISGLLFQSAGLTFLSRNMLPAALGLVAVLGLSGLTDSVFQSFFTVQVYMMLVILLHAANHRQAQS